MVDAELISRKISQLNQYVEELKHAKDITWDVYMSDSRSRAFVERYIHLAIEKVFDISNHIISFNHWREPEGYRDFFQILSENDVIPPTDLANFQNMAAFRNMLVRRYEKIENELVYGIFTKRLYDFDQFILHVKKWVAKQDYGLWNGVASLPQFIILLTARCAQEHRGHGGFKARRLKADSSRSKSGSGIYLTGFFC